MHVFAECQGVNREFGGGDEEEGLGLPGESEADRIVGETLLEYQGVDLGGEAEEWRKHC